MKKSLIVALILVACSMNCAHAQSLGDAVGNIIGAIVYLPFDVAHGAISGTSRGLVNGTNRLVTGAQPAQSVVEPVYAEPTYNEQPVQQVVYYEYDQPMYGTPPYIPGFAYQYWYWHPAGIVFVTAGNQRFFRGFSHGGNFQGHQIRHRSGQATTQTVRNVGTQRGQGTHR